MYNLLLNLSDFFNHLYTFISSFIYYPIKLGNESYPMYLVIFSVGIPTLIIIWVVKKLA